MRKDKVMAERGAAAVVCAIHQVCVDTGQESHQHFYNTLKHTFPSMVPSADPDLAPQGQGCELRKFLVLRSVRIEDEQ